MFFFAFVAFLWILAVPVTHGPEQWRHVAALPILFFAFHPAIFHQLWDSFWVLNQFFHELLQLLDLISEWEQVD